MNKKIINLNAERRKRKPRSIEEMVDSAFRQYTNPDLLAKAGPELDYLASGRTNAQGWFVRDDEDDLLADQERDDEK